MRLKIVIALVFVFAFFFITQKLTFAQGLIPGLPGMPETPQPGISCGIVNGAGDLNKCCQSPITKAPSFNLGDPLLNAGFKLISPLISKYTDPIIEKQKSVVIDPCAGEGIPSKPGDITNKDCICIIDKTVSSLSSFEAMCLNIDNKTDQGKKEQNECLNNCAKKGGLWTAMGCFSGNVSEFIAKNVMGTGIGLAGGISLLCIMMAAFQMQTSSGNAEKVKKAQELMTNCITGLMVIIFSILILKIIGVDILRIPGFG